MKRSKRLYAMLGILVVACIATFAVTQTKEEKGTDQSHRRDRAASFQR